MGVKMTEMASLGAEGEHYEKRFRKDHGIRSEETAEIR
jgi:hypothetical protein